MAKAKEGLQPQKKEKASTARKTKPAPPKKSHISQEFVVESDDEDAAREDRSVKKVVTPAQPQKRQQSQQSKPAPAPAQSSEEDDEDEDEEETDEEDGNADGSEEKNNVLPPRPPNKVPSEVNGVKRIASESVASDEELEEEESDDELPEEPAPKRQKQETAPAPAQEDSSSGEEDGDEDEDSESEEDEIDPDDSVSITKGQVASEAIKANAFQPPAGYAKLDVTKSESAERFSNSALSGQQIWHITAPSDVPLSSLHEVTLRAIQLGKPLLSSKGAEYALKEDHNREAHTAVFVPGPRGFRPAGPQITKTLHLQQKVTLPNLSTRQAKQTTGSAAAADVAEAAVSNVRPQPKGLRMRYRPSGYGDGDPGKTGSGSDSADEDKDGRNSSGFQFPKALGGHGTEQHQAADGAANQEPNGPAKKPKKKRKEKDFIAESPVVNGATVDGKASVMNAAAEKGHVADTTAPVATSAAAKMVAPETAGNGDVTTADATSVKLSKEEKAKRKEEKRLRKEAKLKANAA